MADHWLTREADTPVAAPFLPHAQRQQAGLAIRQALRVTTERGQGDLDPDKLVKVALRLMVQPAPPARAFRLTAIIAQLQINANLRGEAVVEHFDHHHFGFGRWSSAKTAAKVWRHRHKNNPTVIEAFSSTQMLQVTVHPHQMENAP